MSILNRRHLIDLQPYYTNSDYMMFQNIIKQIDNEYDITYLHLFVAHIRIILKLNQVFIYFNIAKDEDTQYTYCKVRHFELYILHHLCEEFLIHCFYNQYVLSF